MKKFFTMIVCFCLFISAMGCQKIENAEIESKDEANEYITASIEKNNYSDFSLIGEYTGKIFSDSDKDVISLYVDADFDKSGNLMKNDMNRWILTAFSGETGESYLLFDEKIQLGSLNFQVADFFQNGKPYTKILLYKNSSAELMMKAFTFEADKGFFSETIYNSSNFSDSGINLRFSTVS